MHTIQYQPTQFSQPTGGSFASGPPRYSGGFGEGEISRNQLLTTNYSSQDHKEAQGSLQLLKKRMSSRDNQSYGAGKQAHSTLD